MFRYAHLWLFGETIFQTPLTVRELGAPAVHLILFSIDCADRTVQPITMVGIERR